MENIEKLNIWLIGEVTPYLPEGIPTVREVMRVYFNYRLILKTAKKLSVDYVAKNLIDHSKRLELDVIAHQDIVRKINTVIDKYDSYKKSMHRNTPTQRHNEQKYVKLLDQFFEIEPKINYHPKKNEKVKVTEPISLDLRDTTPITANNDPKSADNDAFQGTCLLQTEDSDDDRIKEIDSDPDFEITLTSYQKSKLCGSAIKEPGIIHKIINSPDVSSTLDRAGITSPKFSMICAAIAGVVGEDINECVLSTSTCYRRREEHRDQIVTVVKDEFLSSLSTNLVVHWDGKKLRDSTNDDLTLRNKKVDRLAVVVSGVDVQKIITIAKMNNETGLVISDTVYMHINEWTLLDRLIGICTDTTASNTGIHNGSVVLFQNLLKRNILYLACRHHVFELIIGAIFIALFGETKSGSPEMFESFKRDWHLVDQKAFKPLDLKLFKGKTYIAKLRKNTIEYVEKIFASTERKAALKGDYLEMLELCLIVLGKELPNYKFHIPHACSHSRWMAKIIYVMKMYLFRDQLSFSSAEIKSLEDISIFICLVYVKNWIKCSIASDAPHNDLLLMNDLKLYSKIHNVISTHAIGKFSDHLWYLGSELVVLSLFSDKVPDTIKCRMFDKMKVLDNNEWVERCPRLIDSTKIFKKNLDDLVGTSSMMALKSLQLDIAFMFKNDVSEWKNLHEYKAAKKAVDAIHVVNDTAERTLKLMTDFNENLTTNESKKQQSIQVIEDHRKRVPNTKKSTLSMYKKRRIE